MFCLSTPRSNLKPASVCKLCRFAAFLTAVLLYWALCLVVEAGVAAVGRLAEARR